MATLSQGITDLQAAVDALTAEELSVVAAIQTLQQQVASGSAVTGDQLEALATQVKSATSGLQSAITASAPPPVTPPVSTQTGTPTV